MTQTRERRQGDDGERYGMLANIDQTPQELQMLPGMGNFASRCSKQWMFCVVKDENERTMRMSQKQNSWEWVCGQQTSYLASVQHGSRARMRRAINVCDECVAPMVQTRGLQVCRHSNHEGETMEFHNRPASQMQIWQSQVYCMQQEQRMNNGT